MMMQLLMAFVLTTAAVVALAALLTVLPQLGRPGRSLAHWCSRAPLLDVMLLLLMPVPWLIAGVLGGWLGLLGSFLGQVAALQLWVFGHELAHREATRGPRIVHVLNRTVGRWRNHLALWVTIVAVPVLFLVRWVQWIGYPPLIWLLGFPRYNHAEWVNLSRHRFRNLVGHDLAWCLYCDWMTGVWSLGTEMLRNVESFWCPIRFADADKCENCATDFPDVAGGWVDADATMQDVAELLEAKYSGGKRSWFGHPERQAETAPTPESDPHATDHRAQAATLLDVDDEMQREILMDHAHRPRHTGVMTHATHQAQGHMPICDDRVRVYLRISDGRINEISFAAGGCAICTASASMMAQHMCGRSVEDAREFAARFCNWMVHPDQPPASLEAMGDLVALAGVSRFPARVKCATLPWHTLLAALDGQGNGSAA